MRLVLDTNVIVAAHRSARGASAQLLRGAREGKFTMLVSVPLILEYEAVLKREAHLGAAGTDRDAVDGALSALASISEPVRIWYALRPSVQDADDDMVVEAAVNGRAEALVTFEIVGFAAVLRRFGIQVVTPAEAWRRVNV